MNFEEMSLKNFVSALAKKDPVPGGGGAAALTATVGMALGNMVGNLTVGKKKYISVESEIIDLIEKAEALQYELLNLIQRDAECFAPLSKAYGLPAKTEAERSEKEKIMEKCLMQACSVPIIIMEKCCKAIDLTEEFAAKGSKMAISDAGCSAALLKSALRSASLNVYINTSYMKNRNRAMQLENYADDMLSSYSKKADSIFDFVTENIRKNDKDFKG